MCRDPKICYWFNWRKKNIIIGSEAEEKKSVLYIKYPIERGLIADWDNMEKIWDAVFTNELKASPEEHFVLLSEIPQNPDKNREKMAEIMFEKFQVPGLYIENQALLALSTTGKYNGMVIDSGEGITNCVPIMDSFEISEACISLDVAGVDLNDFMVRSMAERGQRLSTSGEKEIARKIKEKVCYVSLDFEKDVKSCEPYDYELPDGSHIYIRDERVRCPEALFNPSIIGKSKNGIAQICYESIQKCNNNFQKNLYNSIILSGGSTMFSGFSERFNKEIKALAPQSMKEEIKITANPDRNLVAWKGASILSTISSFQNRWITKEQYKEKGSSIINKKPNKAQIESPVSIKKEEVIPIYNPKLNLLPTIILTVDYDGKINEELYNNLKKELSEEIGSNNFSITELRKGSCIMKIVLLAELALKGIKASLHGCFSKEIDYVLKKIEKKNLFVWVIIMLLIQNM